MFLWIFWLIFVAALAQPGDASTRLGCTTSSPSAPVIGSHSRLPTFLKQGKLRMCHLQNATWGHGHWGVGQHDDHTGCYLHPGQHLLFGMHPGLKSATSFWTGKLHLQQQCCINNLHDLCGIIGTMGGMVAIWVASAEIYGPHLYQVFPRHAQPGDNVGLDAASLRARRGQSTSKQVLYQAEGFEASFAVSLFGGYLHGLVLKLPFLVPPFDGLCFDDALYFKTEISDTVNLHQEVYLPMKDKV